MPRRSAITLVTLPGWKGGLNREADEYQLTISEAPDALNVNFGVRGAVSKRKGYADWDTTPDEANRALCAWKEIGGDDYLIYVGLAGTIWSGTASPLTDSTIGIGTHNDQYDWPVGCAVLDNILYVTARNASTAYQYTSGGGWVSLAAAAFDGTDGQFPRASFLATHHDRIFAANTKAADGTLNRSTLWWSELISSGGGDKYLASSFIDFDPDDGQEITALASFGESLVIFKNHAVHMLTGKSPESFTRFQIDSQIGTICGSTVATIGGAMFFYDPSTSVWQFDGAQFSPLDENIHSYLRDGINLSYAYKATGWIYDNHYYLSVPWGSDTYNSRTFVLDLRTNAWTEYDYGVASAIEWQDVLYGGSPRNTLVISTLESGLTDATAAIDSSFRTSWLAPEESPSTKHRLRRLDTTWDALGNHDVTVNLYRDFKTASATITQTVDTNPSDPSDDDVSNRGSGWGNYRWRVVSLEFKTTGTTEDWKLSRCALVISSLDRLRGES